MVFAGEALFLAEVCLLVYCVLNIVTTPEDQVRNLPKLVWLLLVVVLPLAGGIAWLLAGRPAGPARSLPYKGNDGRPSSYGPPARPAASSPDDDEEFLRSLRARADAQRREAQREQTERARREQADRDQQGGDPQP